MRYIFIFILAYLIYKTVKRLLGNIHVEIKSDGDIQGKVNDSRQFKVHDDDIQDAEFKDVDDSGR